MPTVATFALTSATTQAAAPFAIGHAFKQGDVPAGAQLVAGFSDFQATPKNAWPDGSLKFAILAGRAAVTANVPLTVTISTGTPVASTALSTADLKATGVAASIGAGAFGTVSWATTDWDAPFMALVSGPKMASWTYRKPIGSDPHLVAWLEVRLWAGGEVEVLPWIENGYLLVASPTNKSATYTFTLGGTSRFSASIDLPNHCRTPLVSGALLSHWLGADPAVVPAHDKAYFQVTRLVPKYTGTVPSNSSLVTGMQATYTPLQVGSYSPSMGTPGYHPSIGLLPEWDVLYLVSSASTVWAAMQRDAYSAGRFGMHFRDENTNRPIRFSQRPTLGLSDGSGVTGVGSNTAGTTVAVSTGTMPATYASTHHPSMGFMAYMVTGRFYHLETLQFVACINYLKNGDATRSNASGIFLSGAGANTTRGAAWSIRTLAQAVAATPDADALAPDLLASMSANIAYNHATYVAQANNPQGFVQPYTDYTPAIFFNVAVTSGATTIVLPQGYVYETDGFHTGWELVIGGQNRTITAWAGSTRTATLSAPFMFSSGSSAAELRDDNIYFEASWQQDFYTAAFGYAKSLMLPLSAQNATKLAEFFAWKARSVVNRFGTAAVGEFLYRDAAAYEIAVAPANTANWTTGAGPWFSNWGEVYAATWPAQVKTLDDGTLRGGNFPGAGSYWGNLMPAIAYAVEHGVTGADAAYARLTGASNYSALAADFSNAPVWAVTPGESSGETVMTTPGPSFIWDTSPLVPGGFVWDAVRGHGIKASAIPTGFANEALLLKHVLAGADPETEYRWMADSVPAGLTLTVYPDSSFDANGADGTYTGNKTVYRDGAADPGTYSFTLSGGAVVPTVSGVTVSPAAPTLAGSATQQFSATVAGTGSPAQTVTWTKVSGVGSISGSGLYTAPAATGSAQSAVIRATSTVDGSKYGEATITVAAAGTPAPTVSNVTVTPVAATVAGGATQAFSATVAGTNSPSQTVAWSASAGSINASTGLFTAPAATGSAQTITITATSAQDGGKTGTATVTVPAASVTPTVTGVTVTPANASMMGGTARTFSATVAGTNGPSQAVAWTCSDGSITSGGLFTAPTATGSVQTVTVTATSTANNTKSGTATVTVAATSSSARQITTVAVTVLAADERGNPLAGAPITAKLTRTDIDDAAGYVVPEEFVSTADDNGVAVLYLWPNTRGTMGSKYVVKITNPDTGNCLRVTATIPEADCLLHQVADAPPACR